MSDWQTKSLKNLADIRVSNVDKKSIPSEKVVKLCNYMDVYSNDYITSNITFMEATANLAEVAKFKVELGDVIITKDSESPDDIGIPSVVTDHIENLVCGYHLALIKPNLRLVDPVFLCKQLASENIANYFAKYAAGSTRYGLAYRAIEGTSVSFPPIKFQKKIATILSTIDTAIEKTEALIAKYQQIKAGLMHDLFTRGVLPNGQLRPSRKQAPELYQKTTIDWIPNGWKELQIKNILTKAEYGISESLTDSTSGIPVLRMNNIQNGSFDVKDMKYAHSIDAYRLRLKAGDVLYNRTNSMEHVGKAARWQDELPECSFASYLVRLNLDSALIRSDFFTYWLNQVSAQQALRRYATPAVQQVNINPTNLQKVLIAIPHNLEEQAAVASIISGVDKKIDSEKLTLNKLAQQKLGLMQDLLTGQVPVTVDEPEAAHG